LESHIDIDSLMAGIQGLECREMQNPPFFGRSSAKASCASHTVVRLVVREKFLVHLLYEHALETTASFRTQVMSRQLTRIWMNVSPRTILP
jgi:hypothetical protein